MGRERQKAKNRSSISKVRHKNPGRTKSGRKKVNFQGNPIIARNWDQSLSLSQNYARLGLTAKLNAPTGGIEKQSRSGAAQAIPKQDPLAIIPTSARQVAQKSQTVQVERDPETGKILRLIQPAEPDDTSEDEINAAARSIRRSRKPLDDPITKSTTSSVEPQSISANSIIPELEAEASQEATLIAKRKQGRSQSERERTWLARLVKRHGDDVSAMSRDRKLNPMQNTEADIKKRLTAFKENGGRDKTQAKIDDA